MKQDNLHPETRAIRIRIPQTEQMEHASPMFLTSSFCYEDSEHMRAAFADEIDANIYSRFSNPSVTEFEERLAAWEGAEACFATASGMSAIFASIMALLKSGDHLLSSQAIFGSTHTVFSKYLPKWGIACTYFDPSRLDLLEDLVQPNTRMIFIETPSNPGLDILDLQKLSEFAKARHILLSVDNCFATPVLQRPLDWGADLVLHSATKWIDGQGRVLGGAVLGSKALIHDIYLFCRSTGPSMSPFNAWVLSRSLETLHVRMERHCENAEKIATALEGHPQLNWVKYPFLKSHPQFELAKKQMRLGGGIVCFELRGGLEQGRRFLDALNLLSLTANLGDTKSIATHPASTTHAKLSEQDRLDAGITPGFIRISVGLENWEDILADITQALERTAVH